MKWEWGVSGQCIQGGPEIGTLFVRLHLLITDFHNYFTVRIRRKIVIILSLNIQSHFKCVATLPCEISSVLEETIENETISVTINNIF